MLSQSVSLSVEKYHCNKKWTPFSALKTQRSFTVCAAERCGDQL